MKKLKIYFVIMSLFALAPVVLAANTSSSLLGEFNAKKKLSSHDCVFAIKKLDSKEPPTASQKNKGNASGVTSI